MHKFKGKSGKRGVKKNNGHFGNDRVSRIAGRAFVAGPVANGTAVVVSPFNIIPANLGNRIAAIASDFEYWRVRRLHVKAVIRNANGFPVHCLAFMPVPPAYFTAPTTFAHLVDFPVFQFASTNAPSTVQIRMGDKALATNVENSKRWLTTDAMGVTDTIEYSAGIVYSAIFGQSADISSSVDVVIEADCEFRSPIDPALSLRKKNEVKSVFHVSTTHRVDVKNDTDVKDSKSSLQEGNDSLSSDEGYDFIPIKNLKFKKSFLDTPKGRLEQRTRSEGSEEKKNKV